MKSLLDTLTDLLTERNLPALLIGGHAASLLGHPRATFDVDLLVPRDSAGAWKDALISIGLRPFHESSNFLQFEPGPDWPVPPVDLMLVDKETFDRLTTDSLPGIGALRTPDVHGLIALKLHSASQRSGEDAERDWSDLRALIRAHSLSLQDPELRAIIERHGGNEAFKRLGETAG